MGREFYTQDRVNLNEVRYGILNAIQMWNSQPLAVQEMFTEKAGMEAYKRDNTRLRWQKSSEFGRGMLTEKTFEIVSPTYSEFGWEEGWTVEGLALKRYMDVLTTTGEGLIAHDELVVGAIFEQMFSASVGAWNGSGSVAPAPYQNNTFTTSHTHLVRQTAISLANLLTNRKLLTEHGYNNISIFCHSDEYTTLLGEMTAIGSGSNAKVSNPASIAALQGDIVPVYGMSLIETDFVPSGYYLMVANGYGLGRIKPIKFHEIPGLEGIIYKDGGNGLHPLDGASMKHDFGLTTAHRGAIVAVKIAANGSYAAPTINYKIDS